MSRATPLSLTEAERGLVAETQRARLAALDEDALVALHARVRRARDKYVKLHRREVATQVGSARSRGKVSTAPRRSADKAEIFEDALARVSSSLAKAARASAAALRAERLAAANTASEAPAARSPRGAASRGAATSKPAAAGTKHTPIERKTVASSRAEGARRQAKRDAR